jgi:hypothetical protein
MIATMTKIADLAIEALRHFKVGLGPGLTADQISTIEATYDFQFNADHAALLSQVSPAGWVDWLGDPEVVRRSLDWPVEGTIFDVEENGFWLADWDPRPATTSEAVDRARNYLAAVPRLIPIVGHRYQPAAPAPSGSPVFSVYQTDVIYYGADLAAFCGYDRYGKERAVHPHAQRLEFWSDLAEGIRPIDPPD